MPKFIPIARPQQQHQQVYYPEKELGPMPTECVIAAFIMIGVAIMLFFVVTWKD